MSAGQRDNRDVKRTGRPTCDGHKHTCRQMALWCYRKGLKNTFFCNNCFEEWQMDNDFEIEDVIRLSDDEKVFDRVWKTPANSMASA